MVVYIYIYIFIIDQINRTSVVLIKLLKNLFNVEKIINLK